MEDFKEKWRKVLAIIRDNVSQEQFDTLFKVAEPISYDQKSLVIGLPTHFYFEQYEGDDYYNLIRSSISRVFGDKVVIKYLIQTISNDSESKVTISSGHHSTAIKSRFIQSLQDVDTPPGGNRQGLDFDPQLNASLNFENYCVGDSNRLPFTIAEYIANNPNKKEFNPFFLYGEVGVGKTHLIQAIGIRIKERNPRAKVLFTTLRQFQNLYQNAAMQHKIPIFINWFQQMDVILFDDLQEVVAKNKTTDDALFPIFNHLHQNGKQLVFTCDRPPVELDGVADRLIDRFKWGITERLEKPDFELRKKILRFKASRNGLNLSDEIIELVAENSTGSVRELEGIIMGILTRSITLNSPITPQLTLEVMKHSVKKAEKKPVNFDMIVEATAEYYRLNPDVIFTKSRVRDIADARQVIMYLCHKFTSLSSNAIGQKLNRRHATVLHGIAAITDRLPYAKDLAQAVESIEAELS